MRKKMVICSLPSYSRPNCTSEVQVSWNALSDWTESRVPRYSNDPARLALSKTDEIHYLQIAYVQSFASFLLADHVPRPCALSATISPVESDSKAKSLADEFAEILPDGRPPNKEVSKECIE